VIRELLEKDIMQPDLQPRRDALHGGSALHGRELHHEYRQRTLTACLRPLGLARPPSVGLLLRDGLRLHVDRLVPMGARPGQCRPAPIKISQAASGYLNASAILAGPTLAAFIMTAVTEGRAGVRRLLGVLVLWRVGIRWYLFASLVSP
jgi:hypothetical protein